jgi:hypothetical protein
MPPLCCTHTQPLDFAYFCIFCLGITDIRSSFFHRCPLLFINANSELSMLQCQTTIDQQLWPQMQKNSSSVNKDKSAAIFCCQMATWLPHMFRNFYLVKNYKTANNSTTTEQR